LPLRGKKGREPKKLASRVKFPKKKEGIQLKDGKYNLR